MEDIRLLTYLRLQNMMAIVMAVAYFAMAFLGLLTKLRVLAGHGYRTARRLFGMPDFRFYMPWLAGLKRIYSPKSEASKPIFRDSIQRLANDGCFNRKILGELQSSPMMTSSISLLQESR